MAYFPLFVEMTGMPVLILGGGAIALTKAQQLTSFGARVTVQSTTFAPELSELAIEQIRADARTADLRSYRLVIAATDDPEVNRQIAEDCARLGILCNRSDLVTKGEVLFPAVVRKGPLTIGITAQGTGSAVVKETREMLETTLPDYLPQVLDWLGEMRPKIKEIIFDQKTRAKVYNAFYAKCKEIQRPLTEAEAQAIIRSFTKSE